MHKVLITKGKKEIVDEKKITLDKPRYYYVDSKQDFSCREGFIKKHDLKKSKLKTNLGKEFFCFDSTFYDDYRKIKRLAQIIVTKDIGHIVTDAGLHKNSIVVEGGSGSGALALYLAKLVKKVYSYDINPEHQKVAKENALFLKAKNIVFKLKDLTKISEKNTDAVILDVPNPWTAIDSAKKSLKTGGFIVSYSPAITQVISFVNEIEKHQGLMQIKTIEIIERRWKIEGRAVRPVSESIGHTGFLTFVRKVCA